MTIIYILAKLISVAITVICYAMMIRAILPIFLRGNIDGNRFYFFLTVITEPFIAPVRYVLVKLNVLQDSPIDFAFMITYFLLIFVQMILPAI